MEDPKVMLRSYVIAIIGVCITAVTATAGQIQIGAGSNGSLGLTTAYITNPTANGCAGCAAGSLNSDSVGGIGNQAGSAWVDRAYNATLFDSTTLTSPTGTTSLGSSTLGNQSGANVSWSMTDPNLNNVTFDMINDSAHPDNNYLAPATAATGVQSITIPVGVFNADAAYVMLQDYWSWSNTAPTLVFNFSSSASNDLNPSIHDTIQLGSSTTNLVRASLDCTNTTSQTNLPCPAQTANGHTINAGSPITSPTTTTIGNATVSQSTIWDASYQAVSGSGVGPYRSSGGDFTNGSAMLDDFEVNWGSAYAGDYLVSITVETASGNASNVSRLALSAITVDQASQVQSTPEPTTVALLLSGLGLFGFARLRRK